MSVFFRHRLPNAPDLLGLAAAHPARFPHLLASTARGGPLAHFSILFASSGEFLVKHKNGVVVRDGQQAATSNFLDELNSWYGEVASSDPRPDPLMPFVGGWFVYLGYELAEEIETRLALPACQENFPIAFAERCTGAIIVNHAIGESWIIGETESTIDDIQEYLGGLSMSVDAPQDLFIELKEDAPGTYLEGVNQSREYILAGDVFQVNLARNWSGKSREPIDACALFKQLATGNAAPFAGLTRYDDAAVVSSSPERLVQVQGRAVQTRPIAGTRPRSTDAAGDAALSEELIQHPKERAEHIMLIDLERNDLGRVCETGSVEVDELMIVESYAHVHHIVSNVRGRLKPAVTPVDVIGSLFPGGTITGCPKVRCMEIIAELEQSGRGCYTGSMGYLGRNGSMDLNILIRSIFTEGRHLNFRTGAGIVADSVPELELAETRTKAKGLLLSLGITPDQTTN